MLATRNQPEIKKMPYWLNILIAIDQLGNTIAGGNPDNTISGRVGFFASDLHKSNIKGYWKALERIIDVTFAPLQGPGHCFDAWQAEKDETDTEATYITRIILGIFVAVGCVVISLILWSAVLIYPPWRYKAGEQGYDSWRQARQSSTSERAPAAPVVLKVTSAP